MIVLLAGYNGFLGRHVEAALKSAKHTVYRYYRHTSGPYDTAVKEADVIVNCAGNTERPESMFTDNVKLTMDLLEGARAFGKRLIHVGSIVEDLPGNSVYQTTKRAATQLCLGYAEEWGVDVCVVKPSTIYGVGDKESAFLPTLWRAYAEDKPFKLVNDYRSWIHVKDVANAIAKLTERTDTKGATYTVASGFLHPNRSVVDLFEKLVGAKVNIEEDVNGGEIFTTSFTETFYTPTISLEQGVREFVAHKREEIWITEQVWLGAEA